MLTWPDGWVLNVFRIPRGKQRHSEPGKRPVVLLIHGFSLSSLSFALLNPNESMAYILADAGGVGPLGWGGCSGRGAHNSAVSASELPRCWGSSSSQHRGC
jgi:hypothetical protein